jgi:hypothetical protein
MENCAHNIHVKMFYLSTKESKLLQNSKTEVIDEATPMKVAAKKTSPARGFLWKGFLNPRSIRASFA